MHADDIWGDPVEELRRVSYGHNIGRKVDVVVGHEAAPADEFSPDAEGKTDGHQHH